MAKGKPTVEGLLEGAEDALQALQGGHKACAEYAQALASVQRARAFLAKRERDLATQAA